MTEPDELRTLLIRVVPDLSALDADEILARATAASPAASRRSPRRALAVVATVLVVLAAAGVALAISRRHDPAPTEMSPPTSLVLHNGDHVHAFGTVEAVRGHGTRLCDPDVANVGVAGGLRRRPPACFDGVTLRGADLERLSGRLVSDGAISGTAFVDGIWHDGVITVTVQRPAATDPGQDRRLLGPSPTEPPCPTPSGGWPATSPVDRTGYAPLAAYNRAHPGTFVSFDVFHPTPRQTVVFALTHDDLAPLRRALDPVYRGGLCLVRSIYSAQQIASAKRDVQSSSALRGPGVTGAGFDGVDGRGQAVITINCVRITPELQRLAAQHPTGLVVLIPWLAPSR